MSNLGGLGAILEVRKRHSKVSLGSMDGPKMLQGTPAASLSGSFGALRGVPWASPKAIRAPLPKHEIIEKTMILVYFQLW